jgi:hypothetical protein
LDGSTFRAENVHDPHHPQASSLLCSRGTGVDLTQQITRRMPAIDAAADEYAVLVFPQQDVTDQ